MHACILNVYHIVSALLNLFLLEQKALECSDLSRYLMQ